MGSLFLNPGMLGFLALGGLPILIHLLNRQRFKRVPWAAQRFLLDAFKKTYRKVQLENLILLLLRTAAVLLAALALARPVASGSSSSVFRDPVHAFLLVDDSFSMGAKASATSRLERGKAMLKEVVDRLPSRSMVTIVLAGHPGESVLKDAGVDEAQAAIASLEVSDQGADLSAALSSLAPRVKASPIPRRQVVILTDLQAAAWPSLGKEDPALEELGKSGVPFLLLDVGEDGAENAAVTGLRMLSRVPVAGRPVRLEAVVRNFGTGTRRNLEVLLDVAGVVRDRQVIEVLEPGSEKAATLFTTFPEPGSYAVQAKLSEDALALDDRRSLGLRATEGLEVLVVDGDPTPSPEDSEAYFLRRALSPEGSKSPIRVTERSVFSFGGQEAVNFRAYDLVALLNVGALDGAMAERLETWIREGGHLLVALGDNTAIGEWNAQGWRDGKGFLPLKLKEVRGPTDPSAERFATLKVADPDDPAAASLKHSKTLSAMNVRRFIASEPPTEASVKVPWVYSVDALPAVAEKAFGSGRTVLVTTALDKEWGDLPVSFDYVALVHDLVYAAVQGGQVREAPVGRPQVLEVPAERAGEALRVVSPDERTERVAPEALASRLRVTTAPLSKAGIYRLSSGNPEQVLERFAANPDPRESDLARIPSPALQQAYPALKMEVSGEAKGGSSAGGAREYWRAILTGVLAILALETLLAWKFGRD